MSQVSVSKLFSADADAIWALIGDPAGISGWHPAIAASPVSNGGKTRTCKLADGAELTEEITDRDDGERRYTYQIVAGPLPVRDYVSTLSARPAADGTVVTWESSFEAVGAPAPEVEAMIRGVYEAGFSALADKL